MKTIEGSLLIGDKIWFNDPEKCRLRIGMFNEEQQKKMEDSVLTEIFILEQYEDGTFKAKLHFHEPIKDWDLDDQENQENQEKTT